MKILQFAIKIEAENTIIVNLKKKRTLPLIPEVMGWASKLKYPWLANKTVQFRGASRS